MTSTAQWDDDKSILLLRHVMRRLRRAAWRQLCVRYVALALFFALIVAAVAVVSLRFAQASVALHLVSATLLATCVVVALIAATLRQPSALQVAIRADLALGLKQQFSTAWEYLNDQQPPEVVQRLARAAAATRLAHQTGRAFPVEWPPAAKFIPVAAIALAMAFVVEPALIHNETIPDAANRPKAHALDAKVLRAGEDLRAFAEHMRQRAEQKGLPRSRRQADNLERLGQRMQDGSLDRERAISELRYAASTVGQDYDAALTLGASVEAKAVAESASLQTLRSATGLPNLESLSRRLARGELSKQDIQKLSENADAMMSLGVNSKRLAEALREHQAGDSTKLQELLRQAQQSAQAHADAAELARAREELARSREQLGDSSTGTHRRPTKPGPPIDGASGGDDLLGDEGREESSDILGEGFDEGSGMGNQAPSGRKKKNRPEVAAPAITTAVRPTGQTGDGPVFTSKIRTLPRANSVKQSASGALPSAYLAELEQVMSRDDVPRHRKRFVREYFLTLTRGAPEVPEPTPQSP